MTCGERLPITHPLHPSRLKSGATDNCFSVGVASGVIVNAALPERIPVSKIASIISELLCTPSSGASNASFDSLPVTVTKQYLLIYPRDNPSFLFSCPAIVRLYIVAVKTVSLNHNVSRGPRINLLNRVQLACSTKTNPTLFEA
jgi:hypothetical protein